ncbi:MAG: hypothetical protein ACTSVY_14005, partial [Candidatus Helarchaeota archaeon]
MKSLSRNVSILLIIIIAISPFLSIMYGFNLTFMQDSKLNDLNLNKSSYSESTDVDWWNVSWKYRFEIGFHETPITSPINVSTRYDEPIDLFLNFPNDQTSVNDSIRVVYYNGSAWSDPIPSQVWNETYYSNN